MNTIPYLPANCKRFSLLFQTFFKKIFAFLPPGKKPPLCRVRPPLRDDAYKIREALQGFPYLNKYDWRSLRFSLFLFFCLFFRQLLLILCFLCLEIQSFLFAAGFEFGLARLFGETVRPPLPPGAAALRAGSTRCPPLPPLPSAAQARSRGRISDTFLPYRTEERRRPNRSRPFPPRCIFYHEKTTNQEAGNKRLSVGRNSKKRPFSCPIRQNERHEKTVRAERTVFCRIMSDAISRAEIFSA